MKKCSLFLLSLAFVVAPLIANDTEMHLKHILRPNSQVNYLLLPAQVDTLSEMISEGVWYGRLRTNIFFFNWEDEIPGKRKDHYTMGVGGSLVYKSAYYEHFGFTLAGYTSQNPWHMDDEDAIYYKVGKGVLSRYDVLTKGEYGISSLAQAYLEYNTASTSIKIGRQIFESRMTKSNDIKMIPNTFEGVTLHHTMSSYRFKAAYLTKQKLRDHTSFHHLFAYDDGEGMYDKYRQNDDTAMHRGITLSKLKALGIDDRLMLFEADNGSKGEDQWLVNYTHVPELFSSVTMDYVHQWKLGAYTLSPAVRYMHQFDHGAGQIGGSNLLTKTLGYSDEESVEANLYGVRCDLAKDAWKLRVGMTHVSDDADIISPWRAFPTGGFGYSLLQYNWYANTSSYLVEGKYHFKSQGSGHFCGMPFRILMIKNQGYRQTAMYFSSTSLSSLKRIEDSMQR